MRISIKKYLFAAVLISLFLCSGCKKKEYTREIFAMDTYMTITAFGPDSKEAVDKAVNKINELDRKLAVRNEDSEIAKLGNTGESQLSDDSYRILKKSLQIYNMTEGAFNPLIYPVMEEWGFDDGSYKLPDRQVLDEALKKTDINNLVMEEKDKRVRLLNGAKLDFGGIAKGYTSNIIIDILKEYGIKSAIINLGGNVHVLGNDADDSPWEIAIKDPDRSEEYAGILRVTDCAVVSSGGYERYFESQGRKYHHIINPANGYPAESGLLSVTVVAKDAALADGLSTALYVLGEEKAYQLWKENRDIFDYVLINTDGKISVTDGLKDIFFLL